MQVKISHACDGATQMALRVIHEGVSEEKHVANSGEGHTVRLGPSSRVEVSFHPYPTPKDNEPAALAMPERVRAQVWRRFGGETVIVSGGADATIADGKPLDVEFGFGETIQVRPGA